MDYFCLSFGFCFWFTELGLGPSQSAFIFTALSENGGLANNEKKPVFAESSKRCSVLTALLTPPLRVGFANNGTDRCQDLTHFFS